MAARDIALMNAVYPDVPAVVLPVDGGGTARFTEVSDTTATAADVLSPKTFYKSDGTKDTGSIATKTSSDMTVNANSVTVPAGYYASQATKNVAVGTAGTPTAIKGSVSDHSISLTPSVQNVTGYIAGGQIVGTPVVVTVSELESGTKQITQNGTGISVSGYSAVDVAVPTSGGTDFIVTLSYNSTTEKWEPDKTYSEIITAYNGGLNIAVKTSDTYSHETTTADGLVQEIDNTLIFFYNVRSLVDTNPYTIKEEIYDMYQSNIVLDFEREYIIPDGSMNIIQNGNNIDVTELSSVNVNVSGGGVVITDTTDSAGGTVRTITAETVSLETKTGVNPSTSSQTISPSTGYTGLASVQINAMPSGTAGTPTATKGTVSNHSISVTPSVTNQTGYITGSTKTGTAVTVNVTELESGNKEITENGTNISVSGYSTVSVAVPSSGSKNVQVVQGTTRTNASSLTAIGSELTVSKTGTYDIYYSTMRTNTSSSYTWATQLYIGGTAYGSENTTWTNNVQNIHLTNISLTANQTLRVYGRESRGTSYYIYAPMLAIVEQ